MNPSNRPRSQPQAILHTPSSWGTTALRWGGGRNQHHSPSWQWRFYCDFSLQKFSKVKTASNPEGYHLENSETVTFTWTGENRNAFSLVTFPGPEQDSSPERSPCTNTHAARSHSTRPQCSSLGSGLQTGILTCSHASGVGSEDEGQTSQNKSKKQVAECFKTAYLLLSKLGHLNTCFHSFLHHTGCGINSPPCRILPEYSLAPKGSTSQSIPEAPKTQTAALNSCALGLPTPSDSRHFPQALPPAPQNKQSSPLWVVPTLHLQPAGSDAI